MTHGLTLGKFAPLHRGHQSLIETALAEVDHLTIMIYDAPEQTRLPLSLRAGWIRALYPQVEVIECPDGPREVGANQATTSMHDAYILKTVGKRAITHFYSSEFYGEHVSRALGASDRRIDSSRVRYPVSGTRIRQDTYAQREWIAPLVYRDLISKVVFLGAPSTGKTTLAQAAADAFNTVWVPEYGREYWEQNQVDRRLTPTQLLEIALGHRQREDDAVANANRFMFIDTDATTTFMFAQHYHGAALPELVQLAETCKARYDVFLLCEDDIPYDDSWDRSGKMHRARFQDDIRADLRRRQIPFIPLKGSLEARVAQVRLVIADHSGPWVNR
jgi:HTH-type transcriptional regulator, transcriptional repressor of NAD biosynthesis genes